MYRRDFLAAVGGATTGLCISSPSAAAAPQSSQPPRTRSLKVLMLGGTGFLGPTIVRAFLDRGHQMTLFNRGRANPHLFTFLERLRGDREDPQGPGLGALRGRTWDVVIDTWQNGPKCVEDSARLLSDNVGQYFYISSIAAYKSLEPVGIEESARLSDIDGLPVPRTAEQTYFVRKTLSERAIADHFAGAVTIFRSHGMRGVRIPVPNDEPYWPARIWRGGDVLAPGDGTSFGQFTDIASLCTFMTHCAEAELSGAYNVMSPPFLLRDYLAAIARVTSSRSRLVWVSREKLAEFDVRPYRDLPMWRPEPAGFYHFNTDKAVRAGFRHRTLEACVASMLDGYVDRHPSDEFVFGAPGSGTLSAEREAAILRAVRS